MIHDEIRSLLDAPPDGEDAPTIDAIEHTLTAGYARALALEAERWRLERRIAQVAAELGGKPQDDRALRARPSSGSGCRWPTATSATFVGFSPRCAVARTRSGQPLSQN